MFINRLKFRKMIIKYNNIECFNFFNRYIKQQYINIVKSITKEK